MLWRQAILRANFTKKLQDKEAMCEQLIKTLQQYEGEMRSNGMQVSARSEEFIQQKNSSDAAFDTPVTSRGSNAAVEKEIAMLRKESKRLEEENKRLTDELRLVRAALRGWLRRRRARCLPGRLAPQLTFGGRGCQLLAARRRLRGVGGVAGRDELLLRLHDVRPYAARAFRWG